MEIEEFIKQISIEYLQESPIAEKLETCLSQLESVHDAAYSLASDPENKDLYMMRVGTILSLAIVGKIAKGSDPQKFTNEEWNEIAQKVLEYGIIMDGRDYTVYVFDLYAKYIDFSVEVREEM